MLCIIGRGSYGEVWLARHRTLGTLRAVKVVRRSDFEEERPFRREFDGIRRYEPISRSHPNLVAILHVGGDDTVFFYLMELADDAGETPSGDSTVGGTSSPALPQPQAGTYETRPSDADSYVPHTLRHQLKTSGHGTANDAIALGRGLAGALAHLHASGLVHRDVKPSNVIFAGGTPKLADIGLVTEVGDSRSYVGTEGYIPPEGPGTASADCYALGKLLYEFATGRDRHDWPAPAAELATRPDRERLLELNAILHRACAPKPADRYADGAAMLADLDRLGAGRSVRTRQAWRRRGQTAVKLGFAATALAVVVWLLAPRFGSSLVPPARASLDFPTLAVLPFDIEGAAPGDDIAYRMTEEVRACLTRVPGLGVIKRRSSEELKQNGDPLALAHSNGINAVIEGHIRQTPGQTLVSLELTETRSGRLLWSASKDIADPVTLAVFVVQSVVDPLGIPLSYSQRNSLAARPTENPRAHRLYWEARALLQKGTEGLEAGLPLLHEAVRLDPNFAIAHADIAGFNITLAETCPRSGTNYWQPTVVAARRAYDLAPNSMEANLAMAGLKETFEYDWVAAEKYYLAGIEANPASGEVHWIYGLFLAKAGRAAEAREHRELALKLDPLEPMNAMNMGHQLFEDEGQHEEALAYYQKAIDQQPHAEKSLCLGNLQLAMHRDPDALKAYEEYLLGSGVSAEAAKELREAHARSGWTGYWQKWLAVMTQNPEKYYRWHDRAGIHARLGQTNDVLACLKKSIENREFFATGIRNPNSWKPYRSHPDFQELLRLLRVDETGAPRVD